MAKEKEAKVFTVDAVCLRDSGFGNAGDVVSLPIADAETGAEYGMLDLHIDAINHAKKGK